MNIPLFKKKLCQQNNRYINLVYVSLKTVEKFSHIIIACNIIYFYMADNFHNLCMNLITLVL
jgi:hypothetical protein